MHPRHPYGWKMVIHASYLAQTTKVAICTQQFSTVRACRSLWDSRPFCFPWCSVSRSGLSPVTWAALSTRSSCEWPTCRLVSQPFSRPAYRWHARRIPSSAEELRSQSLSLPSEYRAGFSSLGPSGVPMVEKKKKVRAGCACDRTPYIDHLLHVLPNVMGPCWSLPPVSCRRFDRSDAVVLSWGSAHRAFARHPHSSTTFCLRANGGLSYFLNMRARPAVNLLGDWLRDVLPKLREVNR